MEVVAWQRMRPCERIVLIACFSGLFPAALVSSGLLNVDCASHSHMKLPLELLYVSFLVSVKCSIGFFSMSDFYSGRSDGRTPLLNELFKLMHILPPFS